MGTDGLTGNDEERLRPVACANALDVKRFAIPSGAEPGISSPNADTVDLFFSLLCEIVPFAVDSLINCCLARLPVGSDSVLPPRDREGLYADGGAPSNVCCASPVTGPRGVEVNSCSEWLGDGRAGKGGE